MPRMISLQSKETSYGYNLGLNQPQNMCYGYNLGNGQIEPDKESLQHKDMLLYTDCQKGWKELAAPSSIVVP